MADLNTKTDTEFKPDLLTKTAEAELGYQAKIVIGGSDPSKFVPNINASFERKIDDEFYLNINADDVLVSDETPVITKEPEITVGDRTDKYFVDSDGHLEYEIILTEKPASNKITLKIRYSPGLEFHHQPALTQKQIDDGKIRPDDIVNSYAIYCYTANGVYQTGKVGHIKRSWAEDSDSVREWCEQTISVSGYVATWEITIPDSIYNSSYPIKIGPNIGWDTPGDSWTSTGDDYDAAVHATDDEGGGTTETLYIRAQNTSATDYTYKLCIFDDNSNCPGTKFAGGIETYTITSQNVEDWFSVAYEATIGDTEKVWLALHAEHDDLQVRYDEVASSSAYDVRSYANGLSADDTSWSSCSYNERYSMYAEYAAAGTTLPLGTIYGPLVGPLGGKV